MDLDMIYKSLDFFCNIKWFHRSLQQIVLSIEKYLYQAMRYVFVGP
jgi:hypothetical protein